MYLSAHAQHNFESCRQIIELMFGNNKIISVIDIKYEPFFQNLLVKKRRGQKKKATISGK